MRAATGRRLLAVLGALAVAGALAPLGARFWWVFELASHFRVQIVVGLSAFVIVFAARRAWTWCGALIVCTAVNVPPLAPYLRPGAAPLRPATLSVLVVNVHAQNDEHAELLAGIARTDPDVVLAVEFTYRWAEHLAPLVERYPHRVLRPSSDAFGMALFSRQPFANVAEIELGPTLALDARLQTTRGMTRLIGVHLLPPTSAARSRQRNAQLRLLAELVGSASGPVIVLGDFNTTPYSPYFADWLEKTGLADAGQGLGPRFTWPAWLPLLGVPIDHCMISREMGVAEYRRLQAFGSDHYPVLVRLVQE